MSLTDIEIRNLIDKVIAAGASQEEMELWYVVWPSLSLEEQEELVQNLQKELELRSA